MCGISGLWLQPERRVDGPTLEARLRRQADTLTHRGPDDAGVWCDPAQGIGLGHRRLAILDLSPAGHQPMASSDARYQIVFNGEIYNWQALRDELTAAGASFRGHSDTEILLAAISAWGPEAALQRCNGMFALALWDRRDRMLHLARDRMGKKPLYLGAGRDGLVFGSELKAVTAELGQPPIERAALPLLLRYRYIPVPWTIYRGVMKLPAASLLTLREADLTGSLDPARPPGRLRRYWSINDAALAGEQERFAGSPAAALDELEGLLGDSARLRMIADVPVGAFLSGGIDSSLVVAMMQQHAARPVKTFSVGFPGAASDESPYAAAVAEHLGTEHTELPVEPGDALATIPDLPRYYDEPFADASAIPTLLISRLTRQHVTVALSGDGGDELFAGYKRYHRALKIWRQNPYVPYAVRRGLAALLEWLGGRRPELRHHDLAAGFRARSLEAFYLARVSEWQRPDAVLSDGREPEIDARQLTARQDLADPLGHMLRLDQMLNLPDDILVKVDRASMAFGLEVRAPLLDYRIAEFAWRLPPDWLMRDAQGKWPLRELLARHVPRELFERPKQGFSPPISHWLRHELRDWAGDLLAPDRLRREGFFRPEVVDRLWRECQTGKRWHARLWPILMFQNWLAAREAE